MSFNLKLFNFVQQQPFLTGPNNSLFFKVNQKSNPDKYYTLKVYNIQSQEEQEKCENEVRVHLIASSKHHSVTSIKGSSVVSSQDDFGFINKKFCILIENQEESLFQVMNYKASANERFTFYEIFTLTKTLVDVLNSLNLNDIAHRNINLFSIFRDLQGNYKLGEFQSAINLVGESFLKSNETFDHQSIYKDDVFNLGLVILELCIMDRLDMSLLGEYLNRVEEFYGNKLRFMLEGMLAQNAKERPTFRELFQFMEQFETDIQNSKRSKSSLKSLCGSLEKRTPCRTIIEENVE